MKRSVSVMAAQQICEPVNTNIDASPVCKKARFEYKTGETSRWTLSKNELVLHNVLDQGVGCLESGFDIDVAIQKQNVTPLPPVKALIRKREQIAVLEASLPEHTLEKLSSGQLFSPVKLDRNGKKNVSPMNYFGLLSDEVILYIFQKLTKTELANVALVCKRFYSLYEDESLWTKMDVSNRSLEPGAFGRIMSRQVIILRMARTRIFSPPIFQNCKAALSDFTSRLMYLDLTMANVACYTLCQIFNKCRRLKKVSLESVTVNSRVLISLSENRQLEVLNLAMAAGIQVEGVQPLLKNCRNLKELNLSWTYLSEQCVDYICKNLPLTLDRFNFSGCRKMLLDISVGQLVMNCPNLRELDLSDCTCISGEAVKRLTCLDQLNFLSLSRCYLVPLRSLLYLKQLKSLVYLDVHGSYINENEIQVIHDGLGGNVNINKFKFSSIARPTVGVRKSTIWNMPVID